MTRSWFIQVLRMNLVVGVNSIWFEILPLACFQVVDLVLLVLVEQKSHVKSAQVSWNAIIGPRVVVTQISDVSLEAVRIEICNRPEVVELV